jgi:hypothetical protein
MEEEFNELSNQKLLKGVTRNSDLCFKGRMSGVIKKRRKKESVEGGEGRHTCRP